MGLKVCKFGGTSMADGSTIQRGAAIVKADAERRYVVVSAPGKRFSGDIKVTDLLYQCSDEYEAGNLEAFKVTFEKIRARFTHIEKEIGKNLKVQKHLDKVKAAALSDLRPIIEKIDIPS